MHFVCCGCDCDALCRLAQKRAQEVEMNEIEGPTLTLLISFMYGRLGIIPADILLPLFIAADAHQARAVLLCCHCFKVIHPSCSRCF